MNNTLTKFVAMVLLVLLFSPALSAKEFDLTKFHNDKIALENPHKGWYHHFPDNHINKYIIKDDSHILDFPGMDHIYIRLAWAYLEPGEGQYNWQIVDDIINKWKAHGIGYAFRISCRETSHDRIEQQYATPLWVKEAGAKGGYYYKGKEVGENGPWEPDFDDPIFLEKLDNFLAAFAKRYDGAPDLRYVDVGSIGDWGEGHTHSGSRTEYNFEQRIKHIDLYTKHFKKSQIIVTDDFVYGTPNLQERRKLHKYVVSKGLSYRDDSILVDWYLTVNSDTYTVRSPEYFDAAYKDKPTVLELEHYSSVKRNGNWLPKPGSSLEKFGNGKLGKDYFRGALALLHATYIGYHGDAHDWLSDNPKLTVELLNQCGYWYFLRRLTTPDPFKIGVENEIRIELENRGAAPAYVPYQYRLWFEGDSSFEITFDSKNMRVFPKTIIDQPYYIRIPDNAAPGEYTLKLKLYSPDAKEDVKLALDPELLDNKGYYTIGQVTIER